VQELEPKFLICKNKIAAGDIHENKMVKRT